MILNKEEAPTIFTHPFVDFLCRDRFTLFEFSKIYTHGTKSIIGHALNNFGERSLTVELVWGDPKNMNHMASVIVRWAGEEDE
jgi:hypothetical protein